MDNLIGKTLDGLYTVRELIGTGGMANVYKAVVGPGGPVPEGTVVAVKVLRQELMHDPDLVRRFKNESKAISLLNHPNIVKVYDVSVSDHLQYIVMEYVDGMTLREYQGFVDFIGKFSHNPILGIGVGIVMTVLIQSSSATIGILIAMASQGLIPLEGAIPVLLGDNIGTCITAIMAAWRANVTAKRVALAHVLFNLIGSILFVTFMGLFIKLVLAVSPAHDIARQIANAHTAFNIINTLIFLPFAAPFIKLVERLLPGSDGVISRKPIYLDVNMLKTPSIAMTLAGKEVVRMGTMARHNVELSIAAMEDMDSRKIAYVLEHEPVIDALEEEVTKYLTQMSETQMSRELSARHTGLLHACNDIERIGDHGETLAKKVRMIYEDNVKFSDEAKAELHTLGQMVLEASGKALEALEKDDKKLAEEAWALCRQVKQYQKEIRKNHIVRLNEKRCDPVAGFVMLELLINMKRVSDHSKNISQLVLGIF